MKIENLRSENNGSLVRVVATVVWEECDRPTQEIYFKTTKEFAQDLSCNPHVFLVACILPAMHYSEARVSIDAEICPELRDGLMTTMGWICQWYGSEHNPVQIEAKTRSSLPTPPTPERAGWFCSGGIDSLATLRVNRLNFPLEHPGFIKDGLFIYGISSAGKEVETADKYLETFDHSMTSLSKLTQEADATLIPVYTNIRHLDASTEFWSNEFQGAALAAVAHSFARRLTTVSISSGGDIANVSPHGSHPLLDPNYSSYDLRIKRAGVTLSRLAKTKLVADWDMALQTLKVCTNVRQMQPGMLNCGKCHKCLRTMTTLLALGKLDQAPTFPKIDLSEKLLVSLADTKDPYRLACYQELIPLLKARGRQDLVRGIEHLTAHYHMKERLKQIDHKFFKENLLKIHQVLVPKE